MGSSACPTPRFPRDLNIVSFRMSSKYIRPGCLDGVVGYVYNPATLAHRRPDLHDLDRTDAGAVRRELLDRERWDTTPATCGWSRPIKLKKQIDQQAFNTLALYQTAYNTSDSPHRPDA